MMKKERRRSSKGSGLSMFFDMDTLKRRNSKSSNGNAPSVFVTMSPELQKRTKTWSRQRRIKIAIMGKSGVGKSALVVRYLTKRYIGEYNSGLETHASTELEIDEEKVLVEIYDTCTCSEEKILDHINWADGFILVFSITDYWSLYEVARLSSIISQTKDEAKTPIVVLSNQTDKEKQRRISRAEANQFLNDLGKPVFRTSAADNYDSVRMAFDEASRIVYKWKFPTERKQRSRSGSFMDPLRDAFNKLSKTTSELEIRPRPRSASSADIDVKKVNRLAQVSIFGNHGGKTKQRSSSVKEENLISSNFLEIPLPGGDTGNRRTRSNSFA